MSIIMSEDHATTDINDLRRNLQTPRTGQSPAEYAQAVHAEEMEYNARWPERIMLILAGAFVAALLLISMEAHAGRKDCCGPRVPVAETQE